MYKVSMKTKCGVISFKTKRTPAHDEVLDLPLTLFKEFPSLLAIKDWAKSRKKTLDYTDIKLTIEKADGRVKEIKELVYFSWRQVFWVYTNLC